MNELAVTIFIVVVPGIIAMVIVSNLTIHKPFSNFYFSLYSIVLGMSSYLILQLLVWARAFLNGLIAKSPAVYNLLDTWHTVSAKSTAGIDAKEVTCAAILSIPLGLLVSLTINKKLLHKFATKVGISSKYGDENLYYYYLNTSEVDWVYIRDEESGFIYQGRVATYSENGNIQEIVLTEVSAYEYYEPSEVVFKAPSLYLSKPTGHIKIEQIPADKFTQDNEKEAEHVGEDSSNRGANTWQCQEHYQGAKQTTDAKQSAS